MVKNMKILIFGIGKYYLNKKTLLLDALGADDEIVAFIDNKIDNKSEFEGKIVYNPSYIRSIKFDKVLIMSSYIREIKEQLLDIGISSENIISFVDYMSEAKTYGLRLYLNHIPSNKGKRILIVTTGLQYNGGTLAAIYAAMSLKLRNYDVWIASSSVNEKLLKEISSLGINLAICPKLPYVGNEELFWVQIFDVILVNVAQMANAACVISKLHPVIWWIHEPTDVYDKYPYIVSNYFDKVKIRNMNIVAVSEIAKRNFEDRFSKSVNDIMSYGIPDRYNERLLGNKDEENKHLIFALVGFVCQRKAQDIFLDAIKMLDINNRSGAEFWIIGSIGNDAYAINIKKMCSEMEQVKIWGTLTRSELEKIYPDIDVVVCPSLEDPLPIVMTEGMMYKKVCIASDSTGTSQYIENGINGFVCKTNDAKDLMQKMKWCIDNKSKLNEIGENARKTYEEYFTLEKFGDRLEKMLIKTESEYNRIKKI